MSSYPGTANALVEPRIESGDTPPVTTLTENSQLLLRGLTGRSRSKSKAVATYTVPEPSESNYLNFHAPSPSPSMRERTRTRDTDDDSDISRNTKVVSLTLVNSGSVARDHLASERTYLAYVRTSLALSSVGVALMQFLKLSPSTHAFAIPISATMIVTGVLVLLFGAQRFFLVQRTLVEGYFPVSVLEAAVITFILGSVIVVAFGAILVGGS
ncbi:hypothetical protein BDN70DRAFT_884501 [Pholiota conissans]|uniref:DUF202 domain-containing protein n=1 Tax=Pholiota conissans TaxID=109636 RepID=A0A9P6CW08_9AGAR|nr:hypothetical protein BDN70DRAFT_884501 [Pholiota conissans]